MRKLALAHFLADTQEHRLAVPVLEALDEEIRRYTLEEWEPGLSLDALRLHLHCQRQLLRAEEPSQEALRKEKDTFARLARLDAAAALELKAKCLGAEAWTTACGARNGKGERRARWERMKDQQRRARG
jgi:hypothetical protein